MHQGISLLLVFFCVFFLNWLLIITTSSGFSSYKNMCTSNSHACNMHTNAQQQHTHGSSGGAQRYLTAVLGVFKARGGGVARLFFPSAVEDSSHLKVCRNVGAAAPSGATRASPPSFLCCLPSLSYLSPQRSKTNTSGSPATAFID